MTRNIISLILMSLIVIACKNNHDVLVSSTNVNFDEEASCKTERDSLTQRIVYIQVDALPENEGGMGALIRKVNTSLRLRNLKIENDYDANYLVAFIVDIDGIIKGERILKDKTNQVGNQMLNIVKSFKWTPAKCNGKDVPMLYKFPLIIEVESQ